MSNDSSAENMRQFPQAATEQGFRPVRFIAQSARCQVWLVTHRSHREPFVIKLPRTDGSQTAADLRVAIQSVRQERAILNQLTRHPHRHLMQPLPQIDYVDKIPMIILEWLGETTLARWSNSGNYREILPRLLELGLGLMAIHGAHYIHRDIKPANCMLVAGRGLVIIDFGSAMPIGARRGPHDGSSTAWYTSPEQATNPPADPFMDVYSFGKTACRALTHRGNPEELSRDPQIQAPVRNLIMACLSVSPSNRPTMSEAAGLLVKLC